MTGPESRVWALHLPAYSSGGGGRGAGGRWRRTGGGGVCVRWSLELEIRKSLVCLVWPVGSARGGGDFGFGIGLYIFAVSHMHISNVSLHQLTTNKVDISRN